MSNIDIFSRIELPKEEVFKYLNNSHTITRCVSPFFRIKNLRCKNQTIESDTHFVQESVFSEFLQFFFNVKEIIPDKRITYEFEGLIKGKQSFNLIEDGNSCIIKESLEFYLFNQFSLSTLDLILSIFLHLDSLIRHFRLKSFIYKDTKKQPVNEFSSIKSYIEIDSDLKSAMSLFDDLQKLSLWLSPLLNIKVNENNKDIKEDNVFSLSFVLPFLPELNCRIEKKEDKKIKILFTNSFLKGYNTWSFIPFENKLIIENTIEIEEILTYLKLIWVILGNTLIKTELHEWNKRLKEVAEKTNLRKHLEVAYRSG